MFRRSYLTAILAFAGLLGAGYWSGNLIPPPARSAITLENPTPSAPSTPESTSPTSAAIDVLRDLAPEHFPAMFTTIDSEHGDWSRQQLRMRMLFARWVRSAPEEGLANVRTHDDGEWLELYITEWTRFDPSGVEAMLVRTGGENEMEPAYNAFAKILAARDPEAYFEMRSKHPEFRGAAKDIAFGALAVTDPARAAEIFASFEFAEFEDQSRAARSLAREWGRQNPGAALEWAWSLKRDQGRELALNAALEGLAERDPHAAAEALTEFTLSSGEKLNPLKDFPRIIEGAISAITGELAKEDLGAALQWLDANVSNPSFKLLEHVSKYLPTDVTSLHAVLSTMENPGLRRRLFFSSIVIPATDSATYTQKAAALPAGDARDAILGNALGLWARSDLAAVSAFVSEEAPSLTSDSTFLTNLLSNANPAQAEQALGLVKVCAPASLPDGFLNAVAIRQPAALADSLSSMQDGPGRRSAFGILASQWALVAPTAAATWASGLGGADAEAAQRSLATSWAHWDSYAASQWIAELPRGAARDGAVTALIAEVVADEADSAFAWAETLEDAQQRAASLGQAYQAWHATNPAQAEAALLVAALTPEEKERLSSISTQP